MTNRSLNLPLNIPRLVRGMPARRWLLNTSHPMQHTLMTRETHTRLRNILRTSILPSSLHSSYRRQCMMSRILCANRCLAFLRTSALVYGNAALRNGNAVLVTECSRLPNAIPSGCLVSQDSEQSKSIHIRGKGSKFRILVLITQRDVSEVSNFFLSKLDWESLFSSNERRESPSLIEHHICFHQLRTVIVTLYMMASLFAPRQPTLQR